MDKDNYNLADLDGLNLLKELPQHPVWAFLDREQARLTAQFKGLVVDNMSEYAMACVAIQAQLQLIHRLRGLPQMAEAQLKKELAKMAKA